MYLVDTNIWLERLLDQDKSAEVGQFLVRTPTSQLMVSDFTLHSIGVILDRLRKRYVLLQFVDDVLIQGGVSLASVQPDAMHHVVGAMDQFDLDFDDAYQYVAADQVDAVIVSFDSDLDRTNRRRLTPGEILREENVAEP